MTPLDTVFVTSDTHFGHENVLRYDQRPFPSIVEHDAAIVANWNRIVRPQDTVYHLGDVARTRKIAEEIIPRLNGKIILIRGNHDDDLWKVRAKLFAEAHEALYIRVGEERFYLSHYSHRVWRNSHHGSYHVYGHSHGALPPLGRSMDAGVNVNNYTPVRLSEVVDRLLEVDFCQHHFEGANT